MRAAHPFLLLHQGGYDLAASVLGIAQQRLEISIRSATRLYAYSGAYSSFSAGTIVLHRIPQRLIHKNNIKSPHKWYP